MVRIVTKRNSYSIKTNMYMYIAQNFYANPFIYLVIRFLNMQNNKIIDRAGEIMANNPWSYNALSFLTTKRGIVLKIQKIRN